MRQKSQTGNAKPVMPFHFLWKGEERKISPQDITAVFQNIRHQKHLIHMIPNTVSAALCADGLSALGARPLMAVAPEEMEEIAAQADGCVVNLGQLNQEKIRAAELAMKCAAREEKPLVVDPVGCGASLFRLQAVQELLTIPWKGIIKGNRSEIYSIQQGKLTREGIDSLKNRSLIKQIRPGSVYLVTGDPDSILWEGGMLAISHERTLRQNVVGSGCLAGAVAGACSAAVHMMGIDQRKQQSQDIGQRLQEENRSGNGQAKVDRKDGFLPEMALAAISTSLGMAFALEHAGQEKGYGAAKSALLDGLCMLSEKCFLDWLNEISKGRVL